MPTLKELYRMRREAYLRDVQVFSELDFLEEVEIMTVEDANTCDFCASQDGRKFPKDRIPDLPHTKKDGCTCAIGCRCTIVAVV